MDELCTREKVRKCESACGGSCKCVHGISKDGVLRYRAEKHIGTESVLKAKETSKTRQIMCKVQEFS